MNVKVYKKDSCMLGYTGCTKILAVTFKRVNDYNTANDLLQDSL